ncbi:TPA: hypothetical protein MDD69_000168 [Klebsiella oxytoca]|nr:hypothetical protein [Klebsiella oxytoca]
MENPAILLRRLHPNCARATESLFRLPPDAGKSLLCQQILPAVSQLRLSPVAAGQLPQRPSPGRDDKKMIAMTFEKEVNE